MNTLKKKIVIVGDPGCGKTSVISRLREDTFTEHHVPTVFDDSTVDLEVDPELNPGESTRVESTRVELTLNDTSGEEDYARLR